PSPRCTSGWVSGRRFSPTMTPPDSCGTQATIATSGPIPVSADQRRLRARTVGLLPQANYKIGKRQVRPAVRFPERPQLVDSQCPTRVVQGRRPAETDFVSHEDPAGFQQNVVARQHRGQVPSAATERSRIVVDDVVVLPAEYRRKVGGEFVGN